MSTDGPRAGLYRTPEERFADLPDFPYEPRYREQDGLRVAHVDVGEGEPIVLLHGEPTWSFVWHRMIPPLVAAGHRCIAADHVGFGRSDKPLDPGWHVIPKHVEITVGLFEALDLREATVVVHDWGGPIGLGAVAAAPDRVSGLVILDTTINPDEVWMNEAWVRFHEFVEATSDLPVAEMVRATCNRDPGAEVLRAYEAPYPVPESKAGLRGAPANTPPLGDPEAARRNAELVETLKSLDLPILSIWGSADLFLTLQTGRRLMAMLGRDIDHVLPDAGHALPEDAGPQIARLISDWLGERKA